MHCVCHGKSTPIMHCVCHGKCTHVHTHGLLKVSLLCFPEVTYLKHQNIFQLLFEHYQFMPTSMRIKIITASQTLISTLKHEFSFFDTTIKVSFLFMFQQPLVSFFPICLPYHLVSRRSPRVQFTKKATDKCRK